MNDFLETDVIILAKTILEDPVRYNGGDRNCHYYCIFCGAESENGHNNTIVKHKTDCPVLIAQDILTRVNE